LQVHSTNIVSEALQPDVIYFSMGLTALNWFRVKHIEKSMISGCNATLTIISLA